MIGTEVIEQDSGRFSKTLQKLAHCIGREIFVAKGSSDSLETMACSRDIFTWELVDIKGLDIGLECVFCFLISHDHVFDNASKCSDLAMMVWRNVIEIRFDL